MEEAASELESSGVRTTRRWQTEADFLESPASVELRGISFAGESLRWHKRTGTDTVRTSIARLGRMKQQGLLLWMRSYRDKFGVRTFVMLQAFVRTEASLDAQRKKLGSGTPVISLFVD